MVKKKAKAREQLTLVVQLHPDLHKLIASGIDAMRKHPSPFERDFIYRLINGLQPVVVAAIEATATRAREQQEQVVWLERKQGPSHGEANGKSPQ